MNLIQELETFAANVRMKVPLNDLQSQLTSIQHHLKRFTEINFEGEREQNNLESNAGMALGTAWAATCLEDSFRTIQFVSGIFEAIDEKVGKSNEPVQVLYAGTGPFATLLLPTLTYYSSKEIQCTLLEFNSESFQCMKSLLEHLNLASNVQAFVNDDATTYTPEIDIDVLVSETMQAGLMAETQVPIFLNLSQFLHPNGIIIPEEIAVSAALTSDSNKMSAEEIIQEVSLMKLNKPFCKANSHLLVADELLKKSCVFSPNEAHSRLVLLTQITIIKGTVIDHYESGLTVPLVLQDLRPLEKVGVNFIYSLRPEIGFRYELG